MVSSSRDDAQAVPDGDRAGLVFTTETGTPLEPRNVLRRVKPLPQRRATA